MIRKQNKGYNYFIYFYVGGVAGTPTYFLNGVEVLLDGDKLTLRDWIKVIDDFLNNMGASIQEWDQ